jgi:PHD/YefM family antitoxin component YafN of YafNO toxin-antitoxin module
MNIQAEKLELIKLIAETESEKVIKKIKEILTASKKSDETDRILSNPVMVKRLSESRHQIKEGKGIKISLDDIWK